MTKRKSMIIGKRQFILAGLVFALAIAVWLNMNYAASDGGFDITGEVTSSKYLGEAQYVAASDTDGSVSEEAVLETAAEPDSMSIARDQRDDTRNEAVELLEDTISDAKAQNADVEDALAQLTKITTNMDNEASIETLLSAKGYSALVVIGDNSVTVTVAADELVTNQTIQIQDAVTSVVSTNLENIKIITVK